MKVTQGIIEKTKRLREADFTFREIGNLLPIAPATAQKITAADYDMDKYKDGMRADTQNPDRDLSDVLKELDRVLKRLARIESAIESKLGKKHSVSQSPYNQFVKECFAKYPDTSLSEVAKEWQRRKDNERSS